MWRIRIRANDGIYCGPRYGFLWGNVGPNPDPGGGCASSIHTILVADLYHFGAGPDPERNLIRIRFRVRDSGRLVGNQHRTLVGIRIRNPGENGVDPDLGGGGVNAWGI